MGDTKNIPPTMIMKKTLEDCYLIFLGRSVIFRVDREGTMKAKPKEDIILTRKNDWGLTDTITVKYRRGHLFSIHESTEGSMSNDGYLWYHGWDSDCRRRSFDRAYVVLKKYGFTLTWIRK